MLNRRRPTKKPPRGSSRRSNIGTLCWDVGEIVELRGRTAPTQLARPLNLVDPNQETDETDGTDEAADTQEQEQQDVTAKAQSDGAAPRASQNGPQDRQSEDAEARS